MRGADMQNIRPMRRQRSPGHWPGNHPRQIKHAQARQGAILCRWQGFGGGITNAFDQHGRQNRCRRPLRRRIPFGKATCHGDNKARLTGGSLKLRRAPLLKRGSHRSPVMRQAAQ